jgi:hypothetical protein
MKNRKQLPRFGYLKNISIDVDAILSFLKEKNMLDFDEYNDIKVSSNSKHKNFVIANEFCKDNFFKEEDAPMMEGDHYKQLYLTDFDETKLSGKVNLHNTNIFERTKRLDPTKNVYLPEADELNYGVFNKLVDGELEKFLNKFNSKITRVRLAWLKGNAEIKPHVDYDPSYIVRFHIPLITNDKAKMYILRGNDVAEMHLPADNRVYFFNSGLKHWVKNNSDQGRLHLIVDVHGQIELDQLEELLF